MDECECTTVRAGKENKSGNLKEIDWLVEEKTEQAMEETSNELKNCMAKI